MKYTPEHQEADKNFLMGARYGKDAERARLLAIAKEYPYMNDFLSKIKE